MEFNGGKFISGGIKDEKCADRQTSNGHTTLIDEFSEKSDSIKPEKIKSNILNPESNDSKLIESIVDESDPRKLEMGALMLSDEVQSGLEGFERDKSFLSRLDGGCVLDIKKGLVPNMRVPGRVYVSSDLANQLEQELDHYHRSDTKQIGNAASLPGIVGASIGLPDIHTGYGFAIGHVAAFDMDDSEAVVTPGGVGFDINCGVRLLRSNLTIEDVRPLQEMLADEIYSRVPVGVGGRSKEGTTSLKELRALMREGMRWAVEKGIAWEEDISRCEEGGVVKVNGSLDTWINQRAEARGIPQLGTLGSGNHYVEVQHVSEIFDTDAASVMGINKIGQICIMIHCGSRGLGHQIAKDAIDAMEGAMLRDGIGPLNDPMLACTRINSPEGRRYLDQMAAASNYAYVNRAVIAKNIREAFAAVFEPRSARDLEMHLVYDVAHNIAKEEVHDVLIDGEYKKKRLLVHRKGSTRAFGPGHSDLPDEYKSIGQPVLVGGSMGTCSYVLAGTLTGMRETFGSTCHGAGRAFGRHEMRRRLSSQAVLDNLKTKMISIRVGSPDSIAEEAPESYKDVTNVVKVCEDAGISRRIFKLEPVCVIKG